MYKNNHHLINDKLLVKTIIEVSKDRNTYNNLLDFDELLRDLSESKVFCDIFNRYKRNNHYYDETLEDLFDTFRKINNLVQIELH